MTTYGACMAREGATATDLFPRGRCIGYQAFAATGSKKSPAGMAVERFGPVFPFTPAGYRSARTLAEAKEAQDS